MLLVLLPPSCSTTLQTHRLDERTGDAPVRPRDPRLHSRISLRKLRELLRDVRGKVRNVRYRVHRGRLGRGEARVRGLVAGRLLLVVDLGQTRVRVRLVFLGEELLGLEELRESLERLWPVRVGYL